MAKLHVPFAVADQAVSSVINLGIGLYAAKSLPSDDFAVFGLFQVVVILFLGLLRASLYEVGVLAPPERRALGQAAALDASLIAAAVFGAGAGLALADDVWLGIGLGAASAALVLQDAVRQYALLSGRSAQALACDSAWLGILLVGPVVLAASGSQVSAASTVAAWWGLAALPGTVLVAARLRWRPDLRRIIPAARGGWRVSGWSMGDWSVRQAASQVMIYGLAAVGGPLQLAGLRAAQLVLGPLNVLFASAPLIFLPHAVGLRDARDRRLVSHMWALSLAMGGMAFLWGLLTILAPEEVMVAILGDQADHVSSFLPPLTLYLTCSGLAVGSTLGLRVLHPGRKSLGTRISVSVFQLLAGLGLYAATGSVIGALWGMALGNLFGAVAWAVMFRRSMCA